MPSPLPPIPDLPATLNALLPQIPRGCVTTYGDLADALGDRSAARWVGEFLVDHPHSADCPCHRVVLKSGQAGNYIAGDADAKLRRLETEGVPHVDGAVDVARIGFTAFQSDRPLARLVEFQDELSERIRIEPLREIPDLVAAVDVAYTADGQGAAALAVVETATGRLVRSATVCKPVRFPYLTGYLSFREIGLLLDVIAEAGPLPPVVFVDGNGMLHPRRAGIAVTLGVAIDHPTIGVGKKLLCGKVDLEGLRAGESRAIVAGDETIGAAVCSTDASKPVFVSVGNRIDLASAVDLAQRQLFGHRLPEVIFHADRLSKVAVRG